MKTLLKNRCCYKNRIGLPEVHDDHELKDINGDKSDRTEDWDDIYVVADNGDEDENGRGGIDGSGGGSEDEDEDENSGEGVNRAWDGNGYGDTDGDEEFGAMDNEERNGEGSSSAKQAGKRKATQDDEPVIQDDEPVIATRSKRKKMNDNNEDHRVAKKAAPKRKQLRK